MKKILAVIPYNVFPPNMGGQRGIVLLYRALSKKINLTAIALQNNFSNENFEIINILPNSFFRYINPLFFFKLIAIGKKNNSTHLLFEHPYFAWLVFLINRFTSFKTIVHSHNIESERFKSIGKWWWKILWYYEKWAYKNASVCWFKTEEDKEYAIKNYSINPQKAIVISYGTEENKLPKEDEIIKAKTIVKQSHSINENDKILLFNGALSYMPNYNAVKYIVENINPILLASNFNYKIIICGKGLPTEFNELKNEVKKNIIYTGFVEDISLYFKACDIFINPVNEGGGVKTKLVEALGFGKYCVSTVNGSMGVLEKYTGGRLQIVDNKNWDLFAKKIIEFQKPANNNDDFYNHYSWDNIATIALNSLA